MEIYINQESIFKSALLIQTRKPRYYILKNHEFIGMVDPFRENENVFWVETEEEAIKICDGWNKKNKDTNYHYFRSYDEIYIDWGKTNKKI